MTARLQVRPAAHRGQQGYSVSGTDTHGRSVRIFARLETTARAIVTAVKASDGDEVDRLLRTEPSQETTP